MRNLIAKVLSLVLLWTFIGPVALVAASGRDAHACCHRAHHPTTHHASFESLGPSHECCRLLFRSQLPRAASTPHAFAPNMAFVRALELPRKHYVELQFDSHPERAPPYSWFSL
jgi:hypothetical protein